MKADSITIRNLFEHRRLFRVPIYQRNYVWVRDRQWEPFWNDVSRQANEIESDRKHRFSHYMGAVVLENQNVTSRDTSSVLVIDGQQRLTTIQLFLAAVRHYAIENEITNIVHQVEGYIFNEGIGRMKNPDEERHKVLPTRADRDIYRDIMALERRELKEKYSRYFNKKQDKILKHKSVPGLLGAYAYFFDKIKEAVENDILDEDPTQDESLVEQKNRPHAANTFARDNSQEVIANRLNVLCESLLSEFRVVEIALDKEEDDAQVIFETLNERGQPLLAADLIRNFIFYRMNRTNIRAEDLFDKYWHGFEEEFWKQKEKQGRYNKERIEFFLGNFISAKTGDEVTQSKLFGAYKVFAKNQQESECGEYDIVQGELKDLVEYGSLYRRLVERQPGDTLGYFAKRLHPWDVTTINPLVMRLWSVSEMDEEEKNECLPILLTLLVRRAICGLNTKHYNKLFLSALRSLEDKGFSYDNLVRFFLSKQSSDNMRIPTDEEFEQAFIVEPIYGNRLTAARIRAILQEIEYFKRKEYKHQEIRNLNENLSVEHIMPVKWQDHWPLPDGESAPTESELQLASLKTEESDTRIGKIVRRNRSLNTLGNLTLLTQSLNSTVRNGPYNDKRKELRNHSVLLLNREVTSHDSWDENKIERRSKELFNTALEIWPFPRVSSAS